MNTFNQTKGNHLTATDNKLIKTSIDNNLQDVSTKNKRLHIITTDSEGNVKGVLYSFEVGIGLGSVKRWVSREIEFKIKSAQSQKQTN